MATEQTTELNPTEWISINVAHESDDDCAGMTIKIMQPCSECRCIASHVSFHPLAPERSKCVWCGNWCPPIPKWLYETLTEDQRQRAANL